MTHGAGRDQQVVLALPAQDGDGVMEAATALQDKAARHGLPSVLVVVTPGAALPEASLSSLTAASRLYLVGTGGHTPEALAALLATAGLCAVGRVSLVARAAAAPAEGADDRSFAARLHAALRAEAIATELAARTGDVTVVQAGEDRGRKRTRDDDGTWRSKAPHSKVVYGWSGDTQTRRWAED